MEAKVNESQVLFDGLMKVIGEYLSAKDYYEQEKAFCDKLREEVLAEHEFYESEELYELLKEDEPDRQRERILVADEIWYISKDDFGRFLDFYYEKRKEAGVDVSQGRDYDYVYPARTKLYKAKDAIVDYVFDMIPQFKEDNDFRHYIKHDVVQEDKLIAAILEFTVDWWLKVLEKAE